MTEQQQAAVEEHAREVSVQPEPEQKRDTRTNITYVFAGASIASQNMMVCMGPDGCGALIREDMQDQHTTWHGSGRP